MSNGVSPDDLDIVRKLKSNGWALSGSWSLKKGDWEICFDTSSWIEVSTKNTPRVFDVHVPGEYETDWTVNLIEHLCSMDDERFRLRLALAAIRDQPAGLEVDGSRAKAALETCYHSWIVDKEVPEGQLGGKRCVACGLRVEVSR